MKATLELINQMQADGVIGEYAIGGAVGATFYLAPAATADLDLFVRLPEAAGVLISLSPIYQYLQSRGCAEQDEYIVVGDWPVQFLPLRNALHEEAMARANATNFEGIPTRVISAEHLVALLLRQTAPRIMPESCNFSSKERWIWRASKTLWNATDFPPSGSSSKVNS